MKNATGFIAAVVLLLIAIGVGVYLYISRKAKATTQAGTQATTTLQDAYTDQLTVAANGDVIDANGDKIGTDNGDGLTFTDLAGNVRSLSLSLAVLQDLQQQFGYGTVTVTG